MIPTSGNWWRGGWHDKWNFAARIDRVLLGAHCKASTHQTVEYQLESNADQRYLRKLHAKTDLTQQLSLLNDAVPVVYSTKSDVMRTRPIPKSG